MHAHTYAMLMVAWLHVYRGNVRARARTYITFIHRYCRLPRTRSAEQILEARLPRCHCGKCWSLSTRRAQEVDADQRWCREKRKRFFGRIIAGETTTRCKIIALLLRKYQASNNQSVFFFSVSISNERRSEFRLRRGRGVDRKSGLNRSLNPQSYRLPVLMKCIVVTS